MAKPIISMLFCDDVRYEQGSKVSLMGVYGPVLMAPANLKQLNKLVSYATISYDDESIGKPCSLTVTQDGHVIIQVPLTLAAHAAAGGDLQPRYHMMVPVEMMGVPIRQGLVFQSVVELEGQRFEGAPLRILLDENLQLSEPTVIEDPTLPAQPE